MEKLILEFLSSIINNGAMGNLIRVPREALCAWICAKCEEEYKRGYNDAGLAAVSALANAESKETPDWPQDWPPGG